MQWRALEDNALRFQSWNDEVVVYNTLSGDTHILDKPAVQILQALQRTPSDVLSLAQLLAATWQCETSDDLLREIEMVLSDMHTLSLVERV
jgi:PqqD family protein of HPr-rel-A system